MDRDARWSHQQSLLAKPLSVVRTRWFVRRHLPDHDLDSIVEDVQLVASELATNGGSLRHAKRAPTVRGDGWERRMGPARPIVTRPGRSRPRKHHPQDSS